ncbi:MAG: DUF4406 domain-containing protein [Erysipelotrichaceae bacterium]|nr:DUF4406 domain-containing protein [Erysipelotrichaceae bacterium]
MEVVYIAGHYRTKNIFKKIYYIYRARKVAIEYWKKGYAVICPHTNSAFFDGKVSDNVFLDGYLELVQHSDILVMLPRWRNSSGARKEHALGYKLNKKIVEL